MRLLIVKTSSMGDVVHALPVVADLRRQLDENLNPSYAGLGGRASAMLRLAEEEAAEIRSSAEKDADEIRTQANRDAAGIRADAAREAEDMRLVQLQELDETRARLLAEAEADRNMSRAQADDLLASAREPDGFMLYEVFASQADADAHKQTDHYLRWRESVARMAEMGVVEAWEVGHGKALSGMIRRISPGMATRAVGTPEEAREAARSI